MNVVVRKWGNSASVRIPAAMLQAANLQLDQTVEMRAENGRLIIEPVNHEVYDLDTLIAGITDENLHGEWDTGPAVGKEIW